MNEILHNKKGKSILFIVLTICFFILIYLLNRIYPLHADDWTYSFVFKDDSKKIENIIDIIRSQYNHYMLWGGRVIVHSIAQLLLMLKPICRTVLNSSAYILYIYLIYYICNFRRNICLTLYIGIFLLAFISLPIFTQTVFWVTGSANYLWGTLIVLPFIFCYYRHYMDGSSKDNSLYTVLFFVYGIIAGWTNENLVAALLCCVFVYLLYLKITKEYIPKWMISGFIGLCVGGAFLIFAPGNFIRAEIIDNAVHFSQRSIYDLLKMRLKSIILISINSYIIILSIIYIALFVYYYKSQKTKSTNNKILLSSLGFFLMAYISIFAMIASPLFPLRATFCTITFLIISIGILFANIQISVKVKRIIDTSVLLILSIFFLKNYYERDTIISDFDTTIRERESIIIEENKKGNKDIILTKKINDIDKLKIEDLSSDSLFWLNQEFCLYYGIKSVKVVVE
ncbi:DUF6056 family protein [Dysgonomonas sp. OttesenSCG-928-M03]|nr:DUF6056 family protein [Dysgonomonas sp. OttesenSCG-928-M03]